MKKIEIHTVLSILFTFWFLIFLISPSFLIARQKIDFSLSLSVFAALAGAGDYSKHPAGGHHSPPLNPE